jgi:hypothetical protein
MKSIILILAIIGIVLVAVGYVKSNLQCPPPRIEYRYIPKSFEDEQNVHTPILSMSGMYSMFQDDTPWIQNRSYASSDVKLAN